MSKAVSIFGLGYVGAVTAACLAHKGHRVVGVDVNAQKVASLNAGHSPIIEAGVAEMAATARENGLLRATTDTADAIANTEISFLSVGTPSLRNGRLDLRAVEAVARKIGQAIARKNDFHTIVVRSTVLPGSAETVVIPLLEQASGKRCGEGFAVCSNPEFLREGSAVADFCEPTFTVLGGRDAESLKILRELYEWAPGRFFEVSLGAAEMIKYVSNAFHALKTGFANEVGTLCTELGIDAGVVTEIYTSDTRLNISKAYLTPGFAFGGSCLPKDLRALNYCARSHDLHLPLLESILPSNEEHIERAVERVLATGRRRVGILGLSFKDGTDDLRESPMVELAKRLIGEGRQLRIWDSTVVMGRLTGSNRNFIEETIPHLGELLTGEMDEVLDNCEVVVVASKSVDREWLRTRLEPTQTLIDLLRVDGIRDEAEERSWGALAA